MVRLINIITLLVQACGFCDTYHLFWFALENLKLLCTKSYDEWDRLCASYVNDETGGKNKSLKMNFIGVFTPLCFVCVCVLPVYFLMKDSTHTWSPLEILLADTSI